MVCSTFDKPLLHNNYLYYEKVYRDYYYLAAQDH